MSRRQLPARTVSHSANTLLLSLALLGALSACCPAEAKGNFVGETARPLRYRPEGTDFVITNGPEFFNRPLYGTNTAFRADAGDKPQFSLFLLVGTAIWAAHLAPDTMAGDAIFSSFIVHQLPAGFSGLVIAGILAAAMSTHSSAISALASSLTYDIYVTRTGRNDPAHLLRIGRAFSLAWGLALIGGALAFHYFGSGRDTPAVVLALSIASVTYGALLGTYVLGGRWARANGNDVITSVVITVLLMLTVVFAGRLSALPGLGWLEPFGRLAWPWYVPLGTLIAITSGALLSFRHPAPGETA